MKNICRNRFCLILFPCVLAGMLLSGSCLSARCHAEDAAVPPLTRATVETQTLALLDQYLKDFQDPNTGVLYLGRFSTRSKWTSPADVKAKLPHPWGYGSRIEDTCLHTGQMLVALLEAQQAHPNPRFAQEARKLFQALRYIYESCDTPGLVPRGPHPDDRTAYYDDSSMDQNTTFIVSLAMYSQSPLASDADKAFIRQTLNEIGQRMEKYDWSIKRADGKTQSHVGFTWKQMKTNGVTILLPAVYALYKGTGNPHWLEAYVKFGNEKEGKRWQLFRPGPDTQINKHPIYANQNCIRLGAFYRLLDDDAPEKQWTRDLLRKFAEIQLERDFPSPFMRRFIDEETIQSVAKKMNWGGADIHGTTAAWELYDKEAISRLRSRERGLATLAHVRFPLGGYHMVVASGQEDLIQQHQAALWKMLNTIDLSEIEGGETNYLFSVVSLQLYAYLWNSEQDSP
ncbi:hypothetical protein Pan153_34280 [Gimesia panareensis]|uniref:Uncharacterized protein n=1 Tax=Gimesia panareensis TaxID=2527978 RepID=A0A518FQY8_9PLAN|nr:hypothetical protein [Gimesia panareensis]QDV18767.1 hypothetical protein Pan153_34280 [Gimesia panareensis]